MFPVNRYQITEEGLRFTESFKQKLREWIDKAIDLPYSTKEGMTLALFADSPGESLSLKQLYDRTDMLPGQVTGTMGLLVKRGLVKRVV